MNYATESLDDTQEMPTLQSIEDTEDTETVYQLLSDVKLLKVLVDQLVTEMYDKDQRIAVLEETIDNMRGTL